MATATNTKKPTPAQPPAKPAAAKPTQKPAAEKTLAEKNREAFDKLPATKRVAVRLSNGNARLAQMIDRIKNWPGDEVAAARATLTQALDGLKGATRVFEQLPDDYKPRVLKGSGSRVELLPGSLVRVTEKHAAEYDGVMGAGEELRRMKVTEVRGPKVFVLIHTKDGEEIKGFFPRGHVCPDVA